MARERFGWFPCPFVLPAVSAAPIAWADGPQSSPSIFAPASTPASSIQDLSWFVLAITGGIFGP